MHPSAECFSADRPRPPDFDFIARSASNGEDPLDRQASGKIREHASHAAFPSMVRIMLFLCVILVIPVRYDCAARNRALQHELTFVTGDIFAPRPSATDGEAANPGPPDNTDTQRLILKAITRAEASGDRAKAAFLRKCWVADDGGAFLLTPPSRADTNIHVSVDLARAACATSHAGTNPNRNMICLIAADWLGYSLDSSAISDDCSEDLNHHDSDNAS